MALHKESTLKTSESESGGLETGGTGQILPGTKTGAVVVAAAEAVARLQVRTQLDQEQVDQFQREQNRLAQENIQWFQQETKEERLRAFQKEQAQLNQEKLLRFQQAEQDLLAQQAALLEQTQRS